MAFRWWTADRVRQLSLKEGKQMKWILWSPSIIAGESFQTREHGCEIQVESSSVPESERDGLGNLGRSRYLESTRQSKGEERVAVRESSEDLQKDPLSDSFSEYLPEHACEEATWSQGKNNLKEADTNISRAQMEH